MNEDNSQYYGRINENYIGDAPGPKSMELIDETLKKISKIYEDHRKWKNQQEKLGRTI